MIDQFVRRVVLINLILLLVIITKVFFLPTACNCCPATGPGTTPADQGATTGSDSAMVTGGDTGGGNPGDQVSFVGNGTSATMIVKHQAPSPDAGRVDTTRLTPGRVLLKLR